MGLQIRTLCPWRESLLVGTLLAVWSLLFRGFDGGRWSDIPIYKSFVDPRLYVHDPFVYALHDGTPAAYTYQVIAAVIGAMAWLPLDGALFILFLPASIISLAFLYAIARQLVGDRLSAALFLLFYVAGFRLLTVGSTILHSAELTPAFLALPFQLGALYALLRERHAAAGALAGLAVVVHTPTSSYVGLAIGLAYALRARHFGLRNVAVAGLLMVLCASPAVAGALLHHTDALPGWALQLARIELATDLSVAVNWDRAALRTYNLAGLALLTTALLALAGRRTPDAWAPRWLRAPLRVWSGHRPEDEAHRTVLALFAAVMVLCAVAFIFIDVSLRGPISTLVARLQFPRSAWIVNLLGLVYVAHYLRVSWANHWLPRPLILTLAAAMFVSPSDFIPIEPVWLFGAGLAVGAEIARRWLPKRQSHRLALTLGVVAPLGAALVALARLENGRRLWLLDLDDGARAAALAGALLLGWLLVRVLRGQTSERVALAVGLTVAFVGAFLVRGSTDWMYQAQHRGGLSAAARFQEWARTETPVDSVFLILPSEPNNDTFYKNADRAVYLVRERANQAVYFTEHNVEFRDRVRALGVSDVLRYREELDPAYRRLTEQQIRELSARFGVTHFVPARAGDYTFPIVYQDGGWMVYQVSP
ncbi:MAG: hypothetical protein IT305_29785 [Chloroflexi bacterium]|nr:hypothetical protein [Chloroflexota bacterium]